MASKRKSTNDIWLESSTHAKRQRTVLSHARTTVRRRLEMTPQPVLKRDSSLTQMDWLHRTTSMRQNPPHSSDDETETETDIEELEYKEHRKTTRKVRLVSSNHCSDEDYADLTLRGAQNRKSKTPGSSAKRSARKSKRLPAQRTTVTQLGYGKPTRTLDQDLGMWEQAWETQPQSLCELEAEETDGATASPTGSVEATSSQQMPDGGAMSTSNALAKKITQSPLCDLATARGSNKRPYQTKTPRKRTKYEIGSSQSPSSPETGRMSPSFEAWRTREGWPGKLDPVVGGVLDGVDAAHIQRTPLLEKSGNIRRKVPKLEGIEKMEEPASKREEENVELNKPPEYHDSQSEVMKLLESSRLRRLQAQRKDAFTHDQGGSLIHQHPGDMAKAVDKPRAATLQRVSTVQDSQSSVSISPAIIRRRNVGEDGKLVRDPHPEIDQYEDYNVDDEVEELPGTYDPVYSALDRDAARAFQTQTQTIMENKVLTSQPEASSRQHNKEEEEADDETTEVHVQRSQEQELPWPSDRVRTSSRSSNVHLIEIEDSEDEDAFPSDPNDLFEEDLLGSAHGLQGDVSADEVETIVPSTPPAMADSDKSPVQSVYNVTTVSVPLGDIPVTPSKFRPSQISTVVPSQRSPFKSTEHDATNAPNPPWNTVPSQTQFDAMKIVCMSPPLPRPPWTPHGSRQHYSPVEGQSTKDAIEHRSSITVDSLADFSLLPPPSQLKSVDRPRSSGL